MQPAVLRELVERAKEERFGLWVRTTNAPTLQMKFAKLPGGMDPEIEVAATSLPDTIFIVKKSVELP